MSLYDQGILVINKEQLAFTKSIGKGKLFFTGYIIIDEFRTTLNDRLFINFSTISIA
jgi:hypothetical protein